MVATSCDLDNPFLEYEVINKKHASNQKNELKVTEIADIAYIIVLTEYLENKINEIGIIYKEENLIKISEILEEMINLFDKFKQKPYLSICNQYKLNFVKLNNEFIDFQKIIFTKLRNILNKQKSENQNLGAVDNH